MSWNETIRLELQNAGEALAQANDGRARVCARRAVGAALAALSAQEEGIQTGTDAMKALEIFLSRPSLPVDVVAAGRRLQARVRPDFTSESADPVADAKILIEYIGGRMGEGPATES